jgi:hypothetical protein
MKGVVFTEFMEMVESQFSIDTLDQVIDQAELPNQGAYTAVGTYDHGELVRMVVALSGLTGVPTGDLVKAFGRYMFGRFHLLYPRFFEGVPDAITFLSGIENVIHAEVIKLYPDAQLPRFDCHLVPDGLDMVYHSPRHFEDLALGLLEGALAHWGGGYSVNLQPAANGGSLFQVRRLVGA